MDAEGFKGGSAACQWMDRCGEIVHTVTIDEGMGCMPMEAREDGFVTNRFVNEKKNNKKSSIGSMHAVAGTTGRILACVADDN